MKNFTKKFLMTLLMLTCVFALTACGAEKTVSEFQQKKESLAKDRACQVVNLTVALLLTDNVNDNANYWLENCNNVELGDWFMSEYAKYLRDSSFICEGKAVKSAFTSFQSGIEDLNSITVSDSPEAVADDETIIVTVPVTGTNVSGSVEVIFTNDVYLKMKSCTLNLDETMGELMTRAALNTLLGMGTVFIVLVLISLIISAFNIIPKIQASFAPKQKEIIPVPAPAAVPAATVTEEEEFSDDMELAAVIAAAIAAYEGTSADGFRVRSIRRANTNKWKKA